MKTGLRLVIGSWNTKPISPPRSARISRSDISRTSRPSKRIEPPVILAGGLGSSPISDIIVTDLPEPLSPTTPSSSPGPIEKLTPLTAWTAPSRVAKTVRRSETSRTGAGPSSMRQAPWRLGFARRLSSGSSPGGRIAFTKQQESGADNPAP